jgi:hypothetical protein
MKKITFDFSPYVLDSWDVMISRHDCHNQLLNQTIFVAHKIDGEIIFENFNESSNHLNSAEKNYIQTILLNS